MKSEVAVFRYTEDGPGAYNIMAVRIESPSRYMRDLGFRDVAVIFTILDGQCQYTDYDPWRIHQHLNTDEMFKDILVDASEADLDHFKEFHGTLFSDKGVVMEGSETDRVPDSFDGSGP